MTRVTEATDSGTTEIYRGTTNEREMAFAKMRTTANKDMRKQEKRVGQQKKR